MGTTLKTVELTLSCRSHWSFELSILPSASYRLTKDNGVLLTGFFCPLSTPVANVRWLMLAVIAECWEPVTMNYWAINR